MAILDVRGHERLVDEGGFDASYYAHYSPRPYQRDAEWLALFDRIAARIASDIQPRTVLDVGCALGFLVETLRGRGIDAFGIDVSQFAIDHVYEPLRPFCSQASASAPLGRRYDLIVSIEVLEHLAPPDAEASIANFCTHTDDVLFSSTPGHFAETTHVNVRPAEYWAAEFARHGFYRDVDFDASFIAPWAVRFRKRTEPVFRLALDYERLLSRLSIERTELRSKVVTLETSVARLETAKAELETAKAELESGKAELKAGMTVLRKRLNAVEQDRAVAAETLRQMKRSWFWVARTPWAWISRKLGRSN